MKKNYIKLIGSIMCAFSMIMTVALVAIGAQANDKKITYVENVTCSELKKEPTAPAEYESGYLFAGWYVEGGEKPNKDGYSPVEEPKVGKSYVAKYVPSEVLGVKAQVSGQLVDNDTDKITNNAVDNAIRFVTSLDSKEYNHIGFNIKIQAEGEDPIYKQDAATTKSVYKTVYGLGADKDKEMTEYTPKIFHNQSEYFKTYAFTTIPESAFDSYITVTPYWITLDGTRVNGPETAVKTVNYGRAWYYVDDTVTDKNTDVPLGTVANPYTTLAEAMNVEAELIPRLILKNDITVDGPVEVAKAMTIAGYQEAKKIKNNITANHLIKVVEGGNLTLDTLTLDGGNFGVYVYGGQAELNNVGIMNVKRGVQLANATTVTGDTLNITSQENGIVCYGGSTFNYNNLNISGNQSNAINVYGNATAIVNGGEFTIAKGNGLNVAGAKAATLKNVDINFAKDATGNGINAYAENNVVPNVILENVDITGAGKHGVALRNGATGSYTGGTVSGSKDKGIYLYKATNDTKGASITLEGVNIENSTAENLYVDNGSTATVNGELTTMGGTHSLYIVNASKIERGSTYSKITINSPKNNGIYLYDAGSKLDVGNMEITGCGAKGIEVNKAATATLSGTVQIEDSTTQNLYLHNKSTVTVGGTLNMTGGKDYSLAVYGASTVDGYTNNAQITIDNPTKYGVRIADDKSLLKAGNMVLTNCKNHGIYIENKGQAEFYGNVSIQGASSGDYDCLYVTGASSQATINGTLTTTGGRYGLAVFKTAAVKSGTNVGTITINSPRLSGVRVFNAGSSLDINVLNVNGSMENALYVENAKATINGGLLTVNSSASGNIFAVKATTSADVTLNDVEIKNPIYHGMAVWSGASVKGSNITISEANGHGIHCGDSGSSFNISNLIISGISERAVNLYNGASVTINGGTFTEPQHGVWLENGATLTLTGTLTVDKPSQRGIRNDGGTVEAGEATVIVTDPKEFGISTNIYNDEDNGTTIPGTTTIGVLNVSGAKGFSSVTVNGTGSVVTINGGKIKDSKGHGVSAEYGTLNLNNVEITGSGTDKYDVWAQKGSTINLNNMINADSLTKGCQSYDESEGATQGTINNN